jgi:transcriptional regulator with XRE-family HTH domain
MSSNSPSPLSFALMILRQAEGLKQKAVATKLGIAPSLLSKYESGGEGLTPERCEELMKALGIDRERLELGLFCAALLLPVESHPGSPAEPSAAVRCRIEAAAARAGRTAFEAAREEYRREARAAQAQKDRRLADRLWAQLKVREHSARLALVEEAPQYQVWALAERLCAESVRAAADDPRQAVELAELALRVAERVSGEAAWLCLLAGYAWGHLGNARRVASDLPAAEQAFRLAWKLWKEGSAADTGLLDGSRLLDLEASLLRAQRHMAAALDRLDQALALHPTGEARGRILLNKGATLEQMGDYEAAVAAFHEAAPWIDREREPRNFCVLRFNRIVCLCHAGRFEEAEAGLPELRALTAQPRQGMDRVRRCWLEGRIAGGLGRIGEGIAVLAAVRAEFAAEKIFYDEALVSLELAVLYLEQGRTAEVKALTGQMEPVFRAQGVHAEAQKALRLFRCAVELETVTVELVRRLVAYLYRAQHNSELRFEAER